MAVEVNPNIRVNWRGENTHHAALNFYPIFILLFEAKVSGVRVQPSHRPKNGRSNRKRNIIGT
jgi:hypothetical protein